MRKNLKLRTGGSNWTGILKSEIKALRSFANGLSRDIDAVENAVAYDYSNGFVEGTNSRLKMIKRTMYGRCGKRLLEAKLRYPKATTYG